MRFAFNLLLCFATLGCASLSRTDESSAPEVAITMDDLPVHGTLPAGESRVDVTARIVAAFRAAGVPEVYGFVNATHVERQPALDSVLTTWTAAGYPLGNHSWSHRNVNQASVAELEREIARNEAPLQRHVKGDAWRWFRYPYLAEGDAPAKRDSVRAVLAQRGYRIAAVTMDYSDWQWNDAYARCRASGDSAKLAALEVGFLDAVRESIDRSRSLSRALYGRDVPYVLLTHVSPFNARMMPRVLSVYREAGFRFTTLANAERDSIYRADVDPGLPAGATSLESRARAGGLPIPPRQDRAAMLEAACR